MIAIKGMDMPKNLQECRFKMVSHKSICCLIDGSVRELNGKTQMKFLPICSNCTMFPYESLPEENKDMSWEELVEKVKQLKSALLTVNEDYISYSAFEGCTHILEFGIDNQIVFRYADEEKIIHTDKSFYGMWVIIKALIGDER